MNIFKTVKNKIFFLYVFTIVISLGLIGWYGFGSARKAYTNSAIALKTSEVTALQDKLESTLKMVPKDINYIGSLFTVKKFFIWRDLKDSLRVEKWRDDTASILRDYMKNRQIYYIIRILDTKGDEQIVLKYNKATKTVDRIAQYDFQNKSHREYFKNVLTLTGRKRPYFSIDPNQLRNPERIRGTNIYVETNLSANSVVKLTTKILELFGYDLKQLEINAM